LVVPPPFHNLELSAFQLPFGDIPQKTLVMAVYDFDRFSKHDQIGQLVIPLGSIDLCESLEDTRDLTSPDDEKVCVHKVKDIATRQLFGYYSR